MEHARIHITGMVQGVGFRPFVYNLAVRLKLRGYCLNDSDGVVIEVHGTDVTRFIGLLKDEAPPLSKIDTLTVTPTAEDIACAGFTIRESVREEGASTLVSPDISICPDCLRELFDPADRRFLYPFINCTNCGPRYTIVRDIPYDRPLTTMAPFRLCNDCDVEYHDPANRRFHAQPNACERCGPAVWIMDKGSVGAVDEKRNFDAVKEARRLLKGGAILAVKGLGGFHLACDAENDWSVKRLRDSKRKPFAGDDSGGSNKPFAVMAPSIDAARRFAVITKAEQEILEGRVRPIALLEKAAHGPLSGSVAPNSQYFGVMLPYTPLHHLLFRDSGFTALVMTSGNRAEEPITISNGDAVARLSDIADFFLLHDRDIYMRADDSIVRVENERPRIIRRARGYTPEPIDLTEEMDEILACGAELKNTFCLTKGRRVILSPHIGDLKNFEESEFFKETLENLKKTFRAAPSIVAHDMHPDYLSTRFALDYAKDNGIPMERVFAVQHHHAHIVSCMAEHGIDETVIGVALDGTGFGADGNIWGGEFLTAGRKGFTREAHLEYVGLPGGDAAVREPWRMALSYLVHAYGDKAGTEATAFFDRFPEKGIEAVLKMIKGRINTPLTSSMGRLFDAVSSIAGVRDRINYEAEAAIELEMIAGCDTKDAPEYPFTVVEGGPLKVDVRPMIRAIVDETKKGENRATVSARFHATVAALTSEIAGKIREKSGLGKVVLSGGVFQNRLLSRMVEVRLAEDGFSVYTHEKVPANDGGVCLGQAASAWARLKEGI